MICVVSSANDRDLSLLSCIKYDYFNVSWRDSCRITKGSLKHYQACDALGCSASFDRDGDKLFAVLASDSAGPH